MNENEADGTSSLGVLLMTLINYCVDMKADQEYRQFKRSLMFGLCVPAITIMWGAANLMTHKMYWAIGFTIFSLVLIYLWHDIKKKCTKDFYLLRARLEFLKYFNAAGISASVESLIQEVNNNWNTSNSNGNP